MGAVGIPLSASWSSPAPWPQGSGTAPAGTCRRTWRRAPPFAPCPPRPAAGRSLPAPCGHTGSARATRPCRACRGRGCSHSLGGGEGHGEVVAPRAWLQAAVVEGVGEEAVQERAEGQAAAPAPREVLHVHVLPRVEGSGCPTLPHGCPTAAPWRRPCSHLVAAGPHAAPLQQHRLHCGRAPRPLQVWGWPRGCPVGNARRHGAPHTPYITPLVRPLTHCLMAPSTLLHLPFAHGPSLPMRSTAPCLPCPDRKSVV